MTVMRGSSRGGSFYGYGRHRRGGPYREPIAAAIRLGSALALIGVIVLFAGPIGYRLGLFSLPLAANRVFVWGGNLAGVAAVLSCLGLLITFTRRREARRGIGRALLAIAVGALAFRAGGRLPIGTPPPVLHDVTTDTQHPPEYVTVAALRGRDPVALVALAYPGEQLASQQQSTYPDIRPLLLAVSRDEAFTRALATVRRLGWTLVSADGDAGRIEASVSTRLFGTVDDVVVRISAAEGGSRVDVRSTAREPGGSTNATRVRAVLEALRNEPA